MQRKEGLMELCERAAQEQDSERLLELVREINEMMAQQSTSGSLRLSIKTDEN